MERKRTVWSERLAGGAIYKELPENSMYEFLLERTEDCLNSIAVEFEGKKTRYSEFIGQIDQVARSLIKLGIKKNDIVSIVSPNIPQAVITVYALNKIGAVANMLHPLFPSAELQYHIENTESRMVFILDMLWEKLADVKWNCSTPEVVLFSIHDALGFPKSLFVKRKKLSAKSENIHYWNEFIRLGYSSADPVFPKSSPEDIALILYSGGTTGKSKGICLTNKNINCCAVAGHEVGEGLRGVKSLAVMPIFHGFGLCTSIHTMLTCGSHLYLLPKYDIDKCNKLIFKERIECIFAVPAIFDALVYSKEMETKDYSFLKLVYCGGDKLKIRTERKFNSYMEKINSPTRIIPGYGLTECVAGCISNPIFGTKEGTAGMAYPDDEIIIVEPGTEQELPIGMPGELCLCGPTVMKGYYKDEEATRKVLRVHKDGKTWLHTGDVFSVDEDGFYTFHSRLGRMFVSNGYNIYPEQIENAIVQLPAVKKCCVVGEDTKIGGQTPVAAVTLNKTKTEGMSEKAITEAVRETCRKAVPEYSLPRRIIILDELPMTKVGKTDFKKVSEIVNRQRTDIKE